MSARLLQTVAAVLAGGTLWTLAAAWSPASAQAAITIFTAANPDTPAATLTRFTCSFRSFKTGRPATRGDRFLRVLGRGGGYTLGLRLPFTGYGRDELIPYGTAGRVYVSVRGPAGSASNTTGGPPGVTNAGSYVIDRGSFGAGVIAIGPGGGQYSFAGRGTCPRPKSRRGR